MTSTYARPTRIFRLRTTLLAACFALANGGEVALQQQESRDAAQALVAAIDAHQVGVRDLQARFTQTVYTPSIQRRETQSGEVWVRRPSLMRWEYADPNPSTLTSDGEAVRVYDPQEAQLQIHSIAGVFSQQALGLLMGQGALSDAYDAAMLPDGKSGEKRVRLTPKDGSFTSLELVVSPDTYVLRASIFIGPFGQQTELRFHDLKENVGIAAEKFQLEIPDGTEVFDLRAGTSP